MVSLQNWLAAPSVTNFPLGPVVEAVRRTGKHFIPDALLADLAAARMGLPADEERLRRFLNTVLDKHDKRFDNPTYLALHDLPLPSTAGRCSLDTSGAERQRDRLITLLITDLLRFEIAACDGTTDLLPLLRPSRKTTAKRCTLAVRLLRDVLSRLGLEDSAAHRDPIEAARELCAKIELEVTEEEHRMLAVTMLPVHTAHDEYLFIRVLQCYETTFALVVAQLRAAILTAKSGNAARTADSLHAAARTMDAAAPLFSLVATMQVEAFMIFREYTDGASAIQSRSYKTIESLCRRPDAARLAGPGYDATPEVREQVTAGQPNLSDAIKQGAFSPSDVADLRAAMKVFETEVLEWRKTHYSIAMRMLGMKRGTGYTAGVPYLAEGKDVPVFKCPFA